MKTLLYALVLVGILSQCAEEQTTPAQINGKLNEEFTLKPSQNILLTSESDGVDVNTLKEIKVRIIEVKDELCPKGFQCITAGSAKVILHVSNGQSYSDTLYLCLGDCDYYLPSSPFKGKSDKADFQFGTTSYVAYFKNIESAGKEYNKTVQKVTLLIESK